MSYRYINTSYLEMVTGGDKDITVELITIFRQQVEEFSSLMTDMNQASNYAELGQIAHKAKSSVAIMGMGEMASLLKRLETNERELASTKNFSAIIEAFRFQTGEALTELDHYLNTL